MSVCPETHGKMIVGVPDGLGAYLKDRKTVRLITQSESYGPLRLESYPFPVNGGAATFTGSHVQYVDYDRVRLHDFMNNDKSAQKMVKGMGEVITTSYNLKGELIGARNPDGATSTGAHFSNTDADGNYVVASVPSQADWLMQSLCSAHLEEKHQWGEGIGVEDTLFITNEEWITYMPDVETFVGLSSHVIVSDHHYMIQYNKTRVFHMNFTFIIFLNIGLGNWYRLCNWSYDQRWVREDCGDQLVARGLRHLFTLWVQRSFWKLPQGHREEECRLYSR